VNVGDGNEGEIASARTEPGSGMAAGPGPSPAATLGHAAETSDRTRQGRQAGRRCAGLSEIDAEIKTLEGGFANVIYLATER
jgi:hypothetical protein